MNSLKLLGAAAALAISTQALAVGNLVDLNVYDRSEGRQLPVYWHEGRAYVVGKPGNEYQLSVRNPMSGSSTRGYPRSAKKLPRFLAA